MTHPAYRPLEASDSHLIGQYADTLENLVRSEGWKVFEKWMQTQEEKLIDDLTATMTSDQLLRSAGALAQLRLTRRWPVRQAQAFRTQLASRAERTKANNERSR